MISNTDLSAFSVLIYLQPIGPLVDSFYKSQWSSICVSPPHAIFTALAPRSILSLSLNVHVMCDVVCPLSVTDYWRGIDTSNQKSSFLNWPKIFFVLCFFLLYQSPNLTQWISYQVASLCGKQVSIKLTFLTVISKIDHLTNIEVVGTWKASRILFLFSRATQRWCVMSIKLHKS